MIQSLNEALQEQGFQLSEASVDAGGNLWLKLINCRYRQERCVRMRLQYLLAALTPPNINNIIVVIESYGLACQQYVYNRELLLRYAAHCIGPYEFDILTPRQEACFPSQKCSESIFRRTSDLWCWRVAPRFETFLGNAKGKFKYDLGIKAAIEGFLPYKLFYEMQASYTVLSTLNHIADFDLFHPSQLLNVATDYIRYRQGGAFTWDMLYAQRSWNFGKGCFGRISGGYFQANYAGLGGEFLWYPAQSCFAIGLEGAIVKKRRYTGLGFQSKLRQFEGFTPVYHPYSTLQQYFLDFYFDFPRQCLFAKLGIGQFLARDKGLRLEATRYFDNGLRITGWITLTDACDMIHGAKYYDRGVAIEVPLDFFYKCSSRRVWNYATAAWLRDAGYRTSTGKPLFDTLNRERRF